MSKDSKGVLTDYSYTQNRELSWLRFNRRVLEEAADDTVPHPGAVEVYLHFYQQPGRVFMVRVGSLVDMASVSPKDVDNKERHGSQGAAGGHPRGGPPASLRSRASSSSG